MRTRGILAFLCVLALTFGAALGGSASTCVSCVSTSGGGGGLFMSAVQVLFGRWPRASKDCGSGVQALGEQAPCDSFCVSQSFTIRIPFLGSGGVMSGVVRGCASQVLKGAALTAPVAVDGSRRPCAVSVAGPLLNGLATASLSTFPCAGSSCNVGPLPNVALLPACDATCGHNSCAKGACAPTLDGVSFTCGGVVPSKTTPTAAPVSQGWKDAAAMLNAAMDTSVDPCQDFWTYSCGNWIRSHPVPPTATTTWVGDAIFDQMIAVIGGQLLNAKNVSQPWPAAINTARTYYQICMAMPGKNMTSTNFGSVISQAGGWPMINQPWTQSEVSLWQRLGRLASIFQTNTLIGPYVDTDWKQPSRSLLYLSQASLTYPAVYYTNPAVNGNTRTALFNLMTKAAQDIAKALKQTVSASQLVSDAQDLINLEFALSGFLVPPSKERQYLPLYNPFTVATASARWPNIDWADFLQTFLQLKSGADPGLFVINEPSFFDRLNAMLPSTTTRTLQNYLVWRLVWSKSQFLPYLTGMESFTQALRDAKRDLEGIQELQTKPDVTCTSEVDGAMQYATGRLYIDFHFNRLAGSPRNYVHQMTTSIMAAFRQMLANLKWMDAVTKATAVNKVNNLIQNYAYPDWILDNGKLNAWYSQLQLSASDTIWAADQKMKLFKWKQAMAELSGPVDRRNFLGGPAVDNAWYQPELNSITFPAGILNPPFFRADFPRSVNYGAMGCTEGHELTHGFDDQGVQWTGNGTLAPWIDGQSLSGFQKMAQCVIDEYHQFCYRFNISHLCISGVKTQGENIADCGGMKAAYLAYKEAEILLGKEAPLPGPMGRFTSDQLFFLAYGLSWCEADTPGRLQRQLLTDVHSPARVRVVAVVRNFPPFQKAFNCPANAPMSPTKHCNVW